MINGLYGAMLLDELLRFTTQQAGWPSTLLRQSTIGLMEELALASRQTANGVLSPSSFDDVKSQTREQLLQDPGLGSMQKRGPLLDLIPRDAKEFGPSSYKCKAWMVNLPSLKTSYISNWRTELGTSTYADSSGPRFPAAIPANDVAAFVASHLLYLGMSSGYLSRWFNYRVQHDPATYSLDQIFEQLEDLVSNGYGEFNILVPLVRPAQEEIRSLQGWLDGRSARKWLADHRLPAPRSIHGAITFTFDAWDLDGALLRVAKSLHSLRQRMLLKTGRAPSFDTAAWIVGVTDPRRMPSISQIGAARTPGYEISEPRVGPVGSGDRLEVAVELLVAALSETGPSMAGMLWAALEALFAAPGDPDRIQVVDRASDVALVTMVRTSIQMSLGSLYSRCPGEALTQRLVAMDLPDRLTELEAALRRGEHEAVAHPGTRMSLIHTARFFDIDILKKRRQEIVHVLRGLYRQRNLILHGGVTDSPLLDSIIRASTPLVTAIVNRYARASGEGVLDPHIFAYQMHVRLENYLVNPKQIVSVF